MIETVLGFIGQILYPLFGIIFYLIDMLQAIFFAFAGINDVLYDGTTIGSGNSGDVNDNGLIFYLLNSTVVRNAMYSIILLAVVLIIIFTVMAFLKNIYADKPKSWKEILGSAIKGIANFFIIPVMCLLGVWLGNILLVAINGATSATNTMNLSRQLFITSSYNANRVRSGDLYGDSISEEEATEIQAFCAQYGVSVDLPSDPNGDTNLEYYAGKIDEVYAMANGPDITFTYTSVSRYYDLMGINYILLAGGGIFILYILVNIAFMMIKRMIMILILFIISPAICAMYPLDDGSKVKSWKESFIQQFLSAFSAVAAMNLFFCISPLIQNIGIPGLDDLMGLLPLLLTIAGLYVVKDLITLINSFIGGDTPFDTGLASAVRRRIDFKKKAQKVAKVVGGAFGAGRAAYRNAKERGEKGVGSFFAGAAGNLGKQFNDASKNWGLGLRGAASDAYDEGQKAWAESHKSQVEEVEKKKNLAKEENKVTDALNAGQAKMTGHEFDTDVRAATRTFGEEIVNNATETIMDKAINDAKIAASVAVGTGAEAEMKKRSDIISGYSGLSGAQVQADMSLISSVAELKSEFEKSTDYITRGAFEGKDADTADRMRKGLKYTDAEIRDASISDAERDKRIEVNKQVDAYARKVEEREAIGNQWKSALKDLANNTNNDAIAKAITDNMKDMMDGIDKAVSSNNMSSANLATDLISTVTQVKDAVYKGVNAQVTTADGIKKVASNTANKRVNSDKDSK